MHGQDRCGTRRALLAIVCTAVALTLSAPAAARKAPPAAKHGKSGALGDRASTLREQGKAAMAKKEWPAAADALTESFRLSPEAKTLYLLGELAWNTGKTVAAQDLMRRFLADPAAAEDAAAKAEADKIVDQPRPASGEVLVVGERGALVSVDDRVVGMMPLPLPLLVSSGEHKVTLEVNGRRLEGPVRVLPGRTAELRFNLSSEAVVARVVPAVVWTPMWKGIPAEPQKLLSKAIEQSVAKQKLSVVSKEVALVQAPRLADCLDQLQCLEQLATQNEAGYTLISSVEASGDLVHGDWTIKLSLVDAPTGDYAATAEKRCERCTADQAGAMVADATTALLQQGAARPKGTLEILTDPPGADVLLTDRRLGQTPFARTLFVGTYDVTLKLGGYPLVRQHLVVEEGKKASTRVTMTPEEKAAPPPPPPPVAQVKVEPPKVTPPPPPPPPLAVERDRRPVWRLATGGVLVGVGVLVGAYGISGLAVNGNAAVVDNTPAMLQSLAPGAAFLGVGAALAITGAVLIALPGPRRAVQASR